MKLLKCINLYFLLFLFIANQRPIILTGFINGYLTVIFEKKTLSSNIMK